MPGKGSYPFKSSRRLSCCLAPGRLTGRLGAGHVGRQTLTNLGRPEAVKATAASGIAVAAVFFLALAVSFFQS
jgi:hypothetical protein